MNRGLVMKATREVGRTTLLFGGALLLVETLLAYVLPTFQEDLMSTWLQVGFIRDLVTALLGAELGEATGPQLLVALPWAHPVVLAIVWAHEITVCTRLPAGEIDRGTIDVLLGLPVTRWEVWLSDSLVWLVSGMVLLSMALIGNTLGTFASQANDLPDAGRLLVVVLNLYCLYLAVGGVAYAVSAASERRGRAIGWIFAVVLASFLLNFLAQLWEPAESVSFLSLLSYYRPFVVFREAGWPLGDMAILCTTGAAFWGLGAVIFRRRDICTV